MIDDISEQAIDVALAELFQTYGLSATSDTGRLRLKQYGWILREDAPCRVCRHSAIRKSQRGLERLPSVNGLIEVYRGIFADEHERHLSPAQKEARAAREEAFWRTKGIRVILPYVEGDFQLASYMAAHMWWLEFVPDLGELAVEWATASARRVWIEGAWSYLRNCADHDLETRRMWAMAHRNAVVPCEKWSEDEFDRLVGYKPIPTAELEALVAKTFPDAFEEDPDA